MGFDKRVGDDKKTGLTFRGREITLSKKAGYPTGLTKMGMEKGIYPEEKRIEAATVFAATGSFEKTAELTKVPEGTIRSWRKTDWFMALIDEVRNENNDAIDAKFNEIIDKALDSVIDRLDNGDFCIHPKTGELVRRPIGAKDLSLVQAINIDKRQLLRGLPTSRTESLGSPDKLEKLAEAFIKLASMKQEPKLLEGVVIDAIQIESSEGVDVREQASNGQRVAEGNTEKQETT